MNKLVLVALCIVAFFAPGPSHAQSKRPMTFEDMMAMKRLGETAVSPDGQWLAYSVSTVDLDQNKSTTKWFIQKIAGGDPIQLASLEPGDSGLQFSADNKQVLFESSRENGQQIWLAAFDPSTGAIANPHQLTKISTEADNARWSSDSKFIVFTSSVYPDCPPISTSNAGNQCNADRDKAAADSKVKAQIFTALLYRHWNHFTGPKRSHLFEVAVENSAIRDLTPNDTHDVPPFSLGSDGGFSISPDSKELAFTENPDEVPAISTSAQIYTLDLTNPSAKPIKISISAGGNFNPAYSPDSKYLAWRSQARAGYESDKFRLMLYDRTTKTTKDMLPNLGNWVDEFAWAPNSKVLHFISGAAGEANLYSVSLQRDIAIQLTKEGEFSDLHLLRILSRPRDGIAIFATKMAVDRPSEIVYVNLGDTGKLVPDQPGVDAILESEVVQITHLNDALLSQLDLPKMEDFWLPAKDGAKVQGFLIRPPSFDPAKKYPVKFLIHGGPQGAWGDSWSYRWNA